MSANLGTAYVTVKPDLSGFSREVKGQIAGAQSGLKSQMAAFAKTAGPALAAGAAVGLGVIAKSAITAASDVNESLSKNAKLFGKYAKGVEKFAGSSAKSYGISKKAALEYTGVFGNLFRALGESESGAAKQSVALTKLAADMASFNNTSVEDALDAIRSGLTGETEPLRKFGVNMNDATLKAQALKMGLISSTKEALDPHTKAMAAQALITAQTSQAHGDFKDTSGSLANQQKILKARLDDASAAIGAKLLPFAVKGANALNDLFTSAQNGSGIFATLNGVWASVSSAFSGSGEAGGKLRDVIRSLSDASSGLVDIATAAWSAFGGVITDQAQAALKALGGMLKGATEVLQGIVDLVAGVFTGDWDRAWDGVKEILGGIWTAMVAQVEYGWETIKNVVSLGMIAIGATIQAAAGALVELGKWIVNRVAEGITGMAGKLFEAAGWIKNRIVEGLGKVADGLVTAGKWIINRLFEFVTGTELVGFLGQVGGWIKNRLVEGLGYVADGLASIGTTVLNAIFGFVQGDTALGFLTSVGGWVKNRLVEVFGLAKDGFLGIGGTVIGWIVTGLKAGVDKLRGFLNKVIGVINKLPGVKIPLIPELAQGGAFSAAGVEAFATGGQIRRGMKLNHPTVLMGEEAPSHPEYVIPTNPAYRGRALSLYQRLGNDLGLPYEPAARGGIMGLALGGVIGDAVKTVGGAAKGVLDLPLGLIQKGASWLLGQFPNPADMLPDWMVGLGRHVVDKVGSWVKGKVTGLLGSSSGGVGGGGGIVALGRRLQKMGYHVSEHPAFGGIQGRHSPTGYHYVGRALDVNADNFPGGEPAALDRLYAMLRRLPGVVELLWRVADHYDHLHVAMAQGGVLGGPKTMQAPFVGSYKNGGVVPRDGLAYVHQGETISPHGPVILEPVIYIGNERVRETVRVELTEHDRRAGATYRAGALS